MFGVTCLGYAQITTIAKFCQTPSTFAVFASATGNRLFLTFLTVVPVHCLMYDWAARKIKFNMFARLASYCLFHQLTGQILCEMHKAMKKTQETAQALNDFLVTK